VHLTNKATNIHILSGLALPGNQNHYLGVLTASLKITYTTLKVKARASVHKFGCPGDDFKSNEMCDILCSPAL